MIEFPPTITAAQYAADRARHNAASIHILPRAVSRDIVETRGLFLAREAVTLGLCGETWRRMVGQLARSANRAISSEARRMLGARP